MIYRQRLIGGVVKSGVQSFPAAVITGARQVGKSTFLQHEFPDFKYVSLDDYAVLEQARRDPSSLWKGAEKVIIDEAQRAPDVFLAIAGPRESPNRQSFLWSTRRLPSILPDITRKMPCSLRGRLDLSLRRSSSCTSKWSHLLWFRRPAYFTGGRQQAKKSTSSWNTVRSFLHWRLSGPRTHHSATQNTSFHLPKSIRMWQGVCWSTTARSWGGSIQRSWRFHGGGWGGDVVVSGTLFTNCAFSRDSLKGQERKVKAGSLHLLKACLVIHPRCCLPAPFQW
ncbi:MAG: AAA family ATPase [Deltaproteobacteria bacterium]|nr:AAA family ATPase [Deltaproteobacteria bacterium]